MNANLKTLALVAVAFLFVTNAHAFKNSPDAGLTGTDILTNAALFKNPPAWFNKPQAEHTIERVEQKLEWSTHRITVYWFNDAESFEAVLKRKGVRTIAMTRAAEGSMFVGPRVTKENMPSVLAHEMTHVILYQKYKGRVPAWLEEGMANFVADNTAIDYEWLDRQPHMNITLLSHPLDAQTQLDIDFKYMASLGVVLMLKEKCPDFRELLNLSLKKNLQTFVPTYCQIPDLNSAFWQWVAKHKATNKWKKKE